MNSAAQIPSVQCAGLLLYCHLGFIACERFYSKRKAKRLTSVCIIGSFKDPFTV